MSSNIGRQIINNHKVNWKGIKEILYTHRTFKKWPFWGCFAFSIFACLWVAIFRFGKSYFLLQSLTELSLSVFPNLLGFSLGGYAIVVGFSNTELIKKSTRTDKHSIYQILSAIFAISILFQVFTVLFCFAISWFIKIDLGKLCDISMPIAGGIMNIIGLFIILFGALYSLVMTPYIVLNLFTLSQLNNMHYTVEVVKEREAERIRNAANSGQANP